MCNRRRAATGRCVLIAAAFTSFEAEAAQVLVDFGTATTQTTTDTLLRTWNNVTQSNDLSGSPFSLLTTANTSSGYLLTVGNPAGVTNPVGFNSNNTNGTAAPTGSAAARGYPTSATSDSLYGNTATFNSNIVQAVRLTLSNLNPAETYSLDFFNSRIGAGGDNRNTEFRVIGGSGFDTSVSLNASENSGNIVGVSGVSPDANNSIVIDIDPGPGNTNSNGFYYLNVLEINSVPEPTGVAAALLVAAGLLSRRRSSR